MALEVFFDQPCDQTLALVTARLADAGFRVEWTFDLRSAMMLVPDCACPHHGTALCDCEYIVLIAYGSRSQTTLVLHGHDGQSWLMLADRPGIRPDLRVADMLGELPAVRHVRS